MLASVAQYGKVYKQGAPVVPPGGLFSPDNLNTPSSVILVDALVRNQAITGAQPLNPT
jgi:hypothetical protein